MNFKIFSGRVGREQSRGAQALAAKANLARMLQEIPLLEEERAAVEDGVEAMTKLADGLRDVATPDGRTPAEIGVSLRGDASPLSEQEERSDGPVAPRRS